MAYELSFSPEFFLAEGEPYDRSEPAVNADGKPISVYSALRMLGRTEWLAACRDAFPNVDPAHVTCEMLFEKIRETNTCRTLQSPVEVYIDAQGWSSVRVYNGPEAERKPYLLVLRADNLEPRDGCALLTLSGVHAAKFAKHQQSIGGSMWEGESDSVWEKEHDEFAYALPTDGAELVCELKELEGEHSIDGLGVFVVEVNWDEYDGEGADSE